MFIIQLQVRGNWIISNEAGRMKNEETARGTVAVTG
jgi:hypothetical protein